MKRRSMQLVIVGVALTSGLGVLTASGDESRSSAAAEQQPGGLLTLEDIVRQVQAQHPGQIVETELEQKNGRYVYEVEVIDDKGVKTELKYDAKTGEPISSKVEHEDDDEDED